MGCKVEADSRICIRGNGKENGHYCIAWRKVWGGQRQKGAGLHWTSSVKRQSIMRFSRRLFRSRPMMEGPLSGVSVLGH